MTDTSPQIYVPVLSREARMLMDSLKSMLKNDLFLFAKYVLKRPLLSDIPHRRMALFLTSGLLLNHNTPPPEHVEDWQGKTTADFPRVTIDKRRRYKLTLSPRKGLKSTLQTEALPLFICAEIDPDAAVMVAFETQLLADTAAQTVHEHLTNNDRFRYLYGDWNQPEQTPWTVRAKRFSIRKRQSRTPSFLATSVGSSLTGLHPTHVILDDPVSLDNIDSEELTRQVFDFFKLIFTLQPNYIWVTGTRYGPFDLYNHIMTDLADHFDIFIRAARNPDGSLWWPDGFSEETLDSMERTLGRWLFMSQMMNMVVPRSQQSLPADKIAFYESDLATPRREDMVVMMGVDPAGAREQGTWAFPVLGLTTDTDGNRHVWLIDHVKAPMTPSKALETFVKLFERWKPDVWGYEDTVVAQAWVDGTLMPEIIKRGTTTRKPIAFKPRGMSKSSRIRHLTIENNISAIMERGHFHARRDDYAFKNEVSMFPSARMSFDLLDMIAYLVAEAFQHNLFPDRPKAPPAQQSTPEYDALFQHAERVLKEARLRSRRSLTRAFQIVDYQLHMRR